VNDRERYLATMRYQPRDRCPIYDFGFWDETLVRWHAEGLPADVNDNAKAARFFGMDEQDRGLGIHGDLLPAFEWKVIRETDQYRWQQRGDGVVEKWHKHSTTIPEPESFLLKERDSWNTHYKPRLKADDPARIPADFKEQLAQNRDVDRVWPLQTWAGTLYGRLRDWIGAENVSLMLYDDRVLVEEMVETLSDCICVPLEKGLQMAKEAGVTFDYAGMWEDICFNRGPLISPTMFRQITGRFYRRVTDLLAKYGCKIVQLDCDGCIDALIPIWLDNGVNCMFPLEIGDWADLYAMRKKWGKGMLMRGGFDKHVLAKGPRAITAAIKKLTPLVEEGAFIPHCDHRVPADVSLANYVHYVKKAKQVWGKGLPNVRPMGKVEK
jgi:uroporphyrinogen decarboxylase